MKYQRITCIVGLVKFLNPPPNSPLPATATSSVASGAASVRRRTTAAPVLKQILPWRSMSLSSHRYSQMRILRTFSQRSMSLSHGRRTSRNTLCSRQSAARTGVVGNWSRVVATENMLTTRLLPMSSSRQASIHMSAKCSVSQPCKSCSVNLALMNS